MIVLKRKLGSEFPVRERNHGSNELVSVDSRQCLVARQPGWCLDGSGQAYIALNETGLLVSRLNLQREGPLNYCQTHRDATLGLLCGLCLIIIQLLFTQLGVFSDEAVPQTISKPGYIDAAPCSQTGTEKSTH